MSANSFGQRFRITTWGESHGQAIGVVIDGCPSGLTLDVEAVQNALDARSPGNHRLTSARKEPDRCQLLSGLFEGKTTGAPISVLIANRDPNGQAYHPTRELLKPGHANFTYLQKYSVFDYRGGGRASARETACRVAAGAIAQILLDCYHITVDAYLQQIGELSATYPATPSGLEHAQSNPLRWPDPDSSVAMQAQITDVKEAGDSIGGAVAFHISGLPTGLGDPIYAKLEACLANAMLSLPASKGFEIGEGFAAVQQRGSTHNDHFTTHHYPASNHAGGLLAGISTGLPIYGRVAFKPTASIAQPQPTVDHQGHPKIFEQPPGSRHDPCVAIRAVPVVKAMCQLVIADALVIRYGQRHD